MLRDKKDFARWLNAEMQTHRIDQPTLTEALDIAEGSVSRWCSGLRTPSPASLQKIAQYFGTDIDFLLTIAGYRPPTKTVTDERDPLRDMIAALKDITWTPDRIHLMRLMLDDMLAVDRAGKAPAPRKLGLGPMTISAG